MVTRRAVLRGTAAASIGAIAAAHGAAPAEAAVSCGFGQLTGGAVGGFQKWRDAFQVSLRFDKTEADIFIKEVGSEGVEIFGKFFQKNSWETAETVKLSSEFFKDLQTSELSFSKIETNSAEFFLKDPKNRTSVQGTLEINSDGLFFKIDPSFNSDGEIG